MCFCVSACLFLSMSAIKCCNHWTNIHEIYFQLYVSREHLNVPTFQIPTLGSNMVDTRTRAIGATLATLAALKTCSRIGPKW